MPAPLVVAGVLGAVTVGRLAMMAGPRLFALGRAAGPAIVRNAPKVIDKGKQLIKQGVDTGSRLAKEYGPGVSQAASGAFKATVSGLSGFVKGAGKALSGVSRGTGKADPGLATGARSGPSGLANFSKGGIRNKISGIGRSLGKGKGKDKVGREGSPSKGGGLKELIKDMMKFELLTQLLSLFKSDKETDESDKETDEQNGIADTTAPVRQPSGRELTTANRNNVTRISSLARAFNDETANTLTVPGQGITTRGGEGRGGDEYVTYSALYKILQDFAEATKSFIASTLQSLLPSINALQASTLNLSGSIKALADLLETSAKQELARKKEESAEAPYKRQTDKELLDQIRGKDPTEKKALDLIKKILLGLGFVAGITPPRDKNKEARPPELTTPPGNEVDAPVVNQATTPINNTPIAPIVDSTSTSAVNQATTPIKNTPIAPVVNQATTPINNTLIAPVVNRTSTLGANQVIAASTQPTIDGVSLPLSELSSNTPASSPNVTRMAPETKSLVPPDVSSFMPTGKKTIQNMVSASINTAINLIDESMAAKKTRSPPAPIVLPAMGSAPTSSPLFSSTNQSPTVFALPSFMSNEPIGELNFI